MSALKIFIAEDEDLLRNGLELVINSDEGMKVVGTAANGLEALAKIEQTKPDLILMDIQMPIMDGIECIRRIRELNSDVIILILTTFNEEEYIIGGLAGGANGYLIKGIDFQKLLQTIRDAMEGQYFLPAEVAAKLVQYIYERNLSEKKYSLTSFITNTFTTREQEIIPLLLDRLTNREMAEKLFVSEGTMKNYLTIIYEKLNVKNRLEAIQCLQRQVK
jgi:DNA-binding NarL/FixJ family response regulator